VTANGCVSFIVAHTTAYESSPTVTYNPDANEYLVVYERRAGSDEFAYHELVGNG